MFDANIYMRILVRRNLAVSVAVTSVILFSVCYYFASDSDDLWVAFAGGWAILIVVAIFNIVTGFIGQWVLSWWEDKDPLKAMFLADLRAMKMPPPARYHQRNWSYLRELSDDPEYEPEDRVRAARLHAEATAMMNSLGFQKRMGANVAFDSAVRQYCDEQPYEGGRSR
jgi:hypothetical protein